MVEPFALEQVEGQIFPADVEMTVTRHYGETAEEKSDELLFHMGIAVVSVTLLIAFVLGRRESLIVFIAIPVTLALTLTVFYLYGYTLNRITLFALIFSIGILVDDAIVVVENIVRHARLPHNAGRPITEVAVEAVKAVGEIGTDGRALEALLELHENFFWQIRDAALIAIRRLLERRVIPPSQEILDRVDRFILTAPDFSPSFSIREHYGAIRQVCDGADRGQRAPRELSLGSS